MGLGPPICTKCEIYLEYSGGVPSVSNDVEYMRQGTWYCPNGCDKDHRSHLWCVSKEVEDRINAKYPVIKDVLTTPLITDVK